MRRIAGVLAALVLLGLPAGASAADPERPRQWNMSMVQADQARAVSRGAGAVVAVIDSGVRASHADLQGRLRSGYDFVQNDGTPQDENGHGTHVTGIVGANTDNGIGIASVAPRASIMPVRVLDAEGGGASADVARGVDWAVARRAHVINLSLGPDVPLVGGDSDFDAAIDRALDRGIIVVAASGNNGLPACDQPSGQGRLLCVGAVDKRRNRSYFSNFGEGLGLVAPGGSGILVRDEGILSTWSDGGYEELDGTSQAVPHVSGVAALLVARGVRGQGAVRLILATASDVGPAGPDPEFGAGIVNAARAVSGLRGSSGTPGTRRGGGRGGRRSSAARVWVRRRHKIRTVLRKGLYVRCLAAGNGRCRVAGRRRGRRKVVSGSRRLRAGRSARVTARVTRRGRRLLRRALRRRKRVRLRIGVALPGAYARRRVVLRP